jgi:hypothetical protein
MTVEVTIPNAVASFVKLAQPQEGDYGNSYRMNLIVDPNFAQLEKLEAAMLEAANNKWADKGVATYNNLKEQDRVALKRRTLKNGEGKVYDGYEGKWFISSARAEKDGRPTVFTATNVEVKDPDEIGRLIYSGCKVHAKLRLWAQDNKGGKRVNAELVGLMFAGEGTPFAGQASVASADDFAQFAVSGEDIL